MNQRIFPKIVFPVVLMILGASSGCQVPAPDVVKMATTTSAANTGLLDTLLPEFEKDTGIHVDYIATGTGKALMHGRNGDVDVVLVHAPSAEEAFVQEGYGVERVPVMWNDFVILGPPDDPAEATQSKSVAEAMRKIETRRPPLSLAATIPARTRRSSRSGRRRA